MAEPLLRLDGVGVRFGGLKAVDEVSTIINRGERRAIIGPNGAGKTTLFNAITGVVRATSGRVMLSGVDVTGRSVHRRAQLGMSRTFQINNLFPNLTVDENMRLGLRGTGRGKYSFFGRDRLDEEGHARIADALAIARLGARRYRLVRELSYGEQRQLEMAMALIARPSILLLDEPAAGLSPAERVIVSDLIEALPRDLTLILIEHDMDLVLRLVDWVTCLNNGRLLVEASPADIRTHPEVAEIYLGKAREPKARGPSMAHPHA